MKGRAALWLFLFGVTAQALAATSFQLVSGSDAGQPPPAGGSGDSCVPLLSPDGRLVLFASTANNLVLATNGLPIPTLPAAVFNVYLRDRSNATTVLVSVNLTGTAGGKGDSLPSGISSDGRYALFESSASDLVPGDTNGTSDIFLRDLVNGVTPLVSISTNGGFGNGASRSAVLTPDGHYVAFVSAANNLVVGDTNGITDVFVRDLQAGITTLASVGAITTDFSTYTSSSDSPDITPDGRFVAFSSTATNLVTGVQTVGDLYVRDLVAGTSCWASAYARAALNSVTGQTNAVCFNHALSADGRFVTYETSLSPLPSSSASGIILRYDLHTGLTDLVHTNATVPAGAAEDIRSLDMTPDGRFIAFVANTNDILGTTTCLLVWDADASTTLLASGDLNNAVPTNSICDWPALDASGRYVAFLSDGSNLVTNSLMGTYHLYLRDLQVGTTMLVDVDTNAVGSLLTCATTPRLSADARFVAFECPDGQLVPNDHNGGLDVFMRDLAASSNELVSAHDPALASPTPNGPSSVSINSITADGRYVAFASEANNLDGTDANGLRDIFVRDLATGSNLLVSADAGGIPGNGFSTEASISGDGRYVAFTSSATNLVTGDTNNAQDVFVRDLQTGTTLLVSKRANGSGAGNKDSYSPVLSGDGRFVMFRSKGTDLANGTFSGMENLFVGNLSAGTNYALTAGGMAAAAMTPNGRFVAFAGALASSSASYLYVWDSQSRTRVYTNTTAGIMSLGLSADGNHLAYATSTQVFGADHAARTNWLISALTPVSRPSPRLNADGKWLTYGKAVGITNQLYLYDLGARTERLVSHAYNSTTPAQGRSDSQDISPDGRFVAYRSLAPNLVASDTNGFSDIFLYDRLTDANMLLSANGSGGAAADSCSFTPVLSADGQMLLFKTWASDILPQDYNHSGHVLAYSFLTAEIMAPATPSQGPWISWPFVPGNTYRVQFKNSLDDPAWQDVPGSMSNLGVRAYLQDLTPKNTQRFYRIFAF